MCGMEKKSTSLKGMINDEEYGLVDAIVMGGLHSKLRVNLE